MKMDQKLNKKALSMTRAKLNAFKIIVDEKKQNVRQTDNWTMNPEAICTSLSHMTWSINK